MGSFFLNAPLLANDSAEFMHTGNIHDLLRPLVENKITARAEWPLSGTTQQEWKLRFTDSELGHSAARRSAVYGTRRLQ